MFRGRAIGAAGASVGEVVFNTAMTGYQEILTDPSYAGQIVTLTYPHIGNVGVNAEDVESRRPFAAGLVIRDLPRLVSNFRSTGDLGAYLATNDIVGIADLDTRRLTRMLREKGAQNGCLVAGPTAMGDADAARPSHGPARRRRWRDRISRSVVSCTSSYPVDRGSLGAGRGFPAGRRPALARRRVRLRRSSTTSCACWRSAGAASRWCRPQTPAEAVLALAPDGVFLSNGPGDPEPCTYAIRAIATIVDAGIPTFGICLGHQLLALASGARTLKMKFGHHGANHPVLDRDTGQVLITSQNHGFAVDAATLPATARVTHVSLFDGSLQGIARTDRPAFGFQGHPEASPGPHDVAYLFDRFIKLMDR